MRWNMGGSRQYFEHLRETARYNAIHKWLREKYGKADRCDRLDCPARSTNYQWAKLPGLPHDYKRENYVRLCTSCHRIMDAPERKPRRKDNFWAEFT